jgi:predicted PurR-regulated permease PerM
VPFVHVLALAPALLMSLLEVAMGTHGWGWLAGVLAVYAAGQVADSVCTPLIVGDAVQLDMVTILVALLIGGAVAGAVGLVLAVPMAATLRILAEELVWPRWRRWASGTTEGPPAPPES